MGRALMLREHGTRRAGSDRRSIASLAVLVGNRVLGALPVLLGVSLAAFAILEFLPGNAAQQLLGAEATAEQVARLEAELGVHRPAWERYGAWMSGIVRADFGVSLASAQPVAVLVAERLPITLELVALAFAMSLLLAVPTALASALKPDGVLDRLGVALTIAALSVPSYVLALLLVLVFALALPLFPAMGFVPMSEGLGLNLRSLGLPALAMALPMFGLYARFLRADLLDQTARADYVALALAKGIAPWVVLLRHVLRNSLFGLLTLVSLNVGALIGGTVIIEQMFGLPGLGQLLLQAIATRDAAVVQAVVLILAVVTVVANLLVDLVYTMLDPRVHYGRR